jgi:hypothetical protein
MAQCIAITLFAAASMKSSTGSTTCRVETLYIRPLTSNESRPLIVSNVHALSHSKAEGIDEKA